MNELRVALPIAIKRMPLLGAHLRTLPSYWSITGVTPWLWLVMSLGALLRLVTLGRQSVWLDEGFSYWAANRSWPAVVALLAQQDTHPPVHYLVLRPMVALGGSEWLLRFPSALASIASIGLLYALGAELFDRRTGVLAAFVLAISPMHIWYGQ